MNKNTIYISFYDEITKKIVPEYIPGEISHTKNWFKNKQYKLILRLAVKGLAFLGLTWGFFLADGKI